jgi:hypothetical protein
MLEMLACLISVTRRFSERQGNTLKRWCMSITHPGWTFRYSTALLAGCAPYMAPELFPEDDTSVDSLFSLQSDVYAFGMLAFEVRRPRQLHGCFSLIILTVSSQTKYHSWVWRPNRMAKSCSVFFEESDHHGLLTGNAVFQTLCGKLWNIAGSQSRRRDHQQHGLCSALSNMLHPLVRPTISLCRVRLQRTSSVISLGIDHVYTRYLSWSFYYRERFTVSKYDTTSMNCFQM